MDLLDLKAPEGDAWMFLVLFGVVVAGPLIVEKVKIPGIIGLFLGGLLVGPHGLDLIGAGNTTVFALGELGLLYLMFVAGLELDLRLVRVHRRSVAIFSILSFSVPLLAGTAAGLLLGFEVASAILLGALLASHTLIVYPTIRRFKLGSGRAVATGVGATVVTDTLALIVLAIVIGSSSPGEKGGKVSLPELVSQVALGLLIVSVFAFLVLPRAAKAFLATFGSSRTSRYVFALVALLSAATVAQVLGIEEIIGAFFAGLALNRLVPNQGDLMDRIDFFGRAVFVPVFVVSVGLVINPEVLSDPETLRMVGIFTLACLGGKALAVTIARPLLGFSWPQAGVLFSLTAAQAAATLAVADAGRSHGLFGDAVYNAVLGLILISLVAASVVATLFGRRVPMPAPSAAADHGRLVLLMIANDSQIRPRVAELAVRLASTDGGVVRPVVVLPEGGDAPDVEGLEALERRLAVMGIDLPVTLRVDHSLNAALGHELTSTGATAVVVDDGEGQWRRELESEASSSPVPVLLISAVGSGERRVVSFGGNPSGAGLVDDIANRLAPPRTKVVLGDGTSGGTEEGATDLVVTTSQADVGPAGDRALTLVTLI